MLLKLQRYSFELKYRKGTEMYLQWNRHNTLQSGELDSTHNSLDATLAIAYTHILDWSYP